MTYSIVANTPPVIDQFDPTPLSLYPGHSVATNVSAHDDLKITKLTFTSTIGTGTPSNQTLFPNVPAVTNQNFNVAIPIDIQAMRLDEETTAKTGQELARRRELEDRIDGLSRAPERVAAAPLGHVDIPVAIDAGAGR